MSQTETEPELAMDLAAELRAGETHLPLARLFAAATLIGPGQATLVVLDSVAGPPDVLHELLYGPIDVLAKALQIKSWGTGQNFPKSFCGDERAAAHRCQLTYRNAITGHDVGFPAIEASHDLAAVVSQRSLSDLSRHRRIVARVRRSASRD